MKHFLVAGALLAAPYGVARAADSVQYPITVLAQPDSHVQFLWGQFSGYRGIISLCYAFTIPDGTKIDGVRMHFHFLRFDGTPIHFLPLKAESDDVALLQGPGWPSTGVFSDCFFGTNQDRQLGIEPSKGMTIVLTSVHSPEKKPWTDLASPDPSTATATVLPTVVPAPLPRPSKKP